MPKREAHIALRTVLVKLFSEKSDALLAAKDAGLNTAMIDFSGSILNIWENILAQAEKENKVDAVIKVAKSNYPQHGELQQAAQFYAHPTGAEVSAPAPSVSPQANKPHTTNINTGGGAYIAGNVNTEGGDFVGRDKINNSKAAQSAQSSSSTYPDAERQTALQAQLAQHQRNLNHLQAQKAIYARGEEPLHLLNQLEHEEQEIQRIQAELLQTQPNPAKTPIREKIRLDVATPNRVVIHQAFAIGVAIKQPDSPLLTIPDLSNVTYAEGNIFRDNEEDRIRYRVEVSSAECEIQKTGYTFLLKAGTDSPVRYFQLIPKRQGTISIIVDAYQENDVVATTFVHVEVSLEAREGDYHWLAPWSQNRPQDAQSILDWLNATSLKANPFGPIGAIDDPNLPEYYFDPGVYSKKIHGRRSTIIFGALGSGKTAAALLRVNDCRMPEGNPRQPDCFPVYIDLNSNADCMYESSIQMVIHKIGLELLGFLALNPNAFLRASKRSQDAMKSTMAGVAETTEGIVTHLQKRGLADDYQAKQFVDKLYEESIPTVQMSDELWLEDLKYICPYSFKYLALVVDVHTHQWQLAEKRAAVNQFKYCLQSLVDLIPRLSKTQVCVKMFLPDQCRAALVLPAGIEEATLAWGITDMKQMLASRLTWANGSNNFNTLFDPASRNRTPSPTDLLVNAAKNSPLRLIELGNRLIEAHVDHYPTKAEFSYEELEAILADVN